MNDYPLVWPHEPPLRAEAVAIDGQIMTLVEYDTEFIDLAVAECLGFRQGSSGFIGTLRALEKDEWESLITAPLAFQHFSPKSVHGLEVVESPKSIPDVVKEWVVQTYYTDPHRLSSILSVNDVELPLREVVGSIVDGQISDETSAVLRFAVLDLMERSTVTGIEDVQLNSLFEQLDAVDSVRGDRLLRDAEISPPKVLHYPGEVLTLADGESQSKVRVATTCYAGDQIVRVFTNSPSLVANIAVPSVRSVPLALVQLSIDDQSEPHQEAESSDQALTLVSKACELVSRRFDEIRGNDSGLFEGEYGLQLAQEAAGEDPRSSFSDEPGTFHIDSFVTALRKRSTDWKSVQDEGTPICELAETFADSLELLSEHFNNFLRSEALPPELFSVRINPYDDTRHIDISCRYRPFSYSEVGRSFAELDTEFVRTRIDGHLFHLVGKASFGFRLDAARAEPEWSNLPHKVRLQLQSHLDTSDFDRFEHDLLQAIKDYEFPLGSEISDVGRLLSSYRGVASESSYTPMLPRSPEYLDLEGGSHNIYRHKTTGVCYLQKDGVKDALRNLDARDFHFGRSYREVAEEPITALLGKGRPAMIEEALARLDILEMIGQSAAQTYRQMSEQQTETFISKLALRLQTDPVVTNARPRFQDAEVAKDYAEKIHASLVRSNEAIPVYGYLAFSRNYNRWGVPTVDERWLGRLLFSEIEKEIIKEVKSRRGAGNSKVVPINLLALIDPDLFEALENRSLEYKAELQHSLRKDGHTSSKGERQDAGIVYGLARKDLARKWTDDVGAYLGSLSDTGRQDFAKKSSVWPRPKMDALVKNGYQPASAWLIDYYYRNCPTKPHSGSMQLVEGYIKSVSQLRDGLMGSKELDDTLSFLERWHAEHAPFKYSDPADPAARLLIRSSDCPDYLLVRRGRYYLRQPQIFTSPYADPATLERMKHETSHNTSWGWVSGSRRTSNTTARLGLHSAPHLEHVKREGSEIIRPAELNEMDFIRQFGFSGVEYGEWTNQAERAQCLTFAYDSFEDLARIFALPKTSLSMGGRLGLCFGSRGRGGRGAALAHFEPINFAINLTRLKGAGSLGHEFVHAIDGMLASTAGFAPGAFLSDWADRNKSSLCGEVQFKLSGLTEDITRSFWRVYQTLYYSLESASDLETASAERGGITLKKSDFVIFSEKQDKDEKRSNTYWSKPCELLARGLERWMAYRLAKEGVTNTYLLNDQRWSEAGVLSQLYPSVKQVQIVDQAMEQFIQNLRTRTIELDHPVGEKMDIAILYSRDCVRRYSDSELLKQLCLDEVARMVGELASVEIASDLHDEAGLDVAGQWDRASRVIRLSQEYMDVSVARHEIYHAASDLLLTDSEREEVELTFRDGSSAYESLKAALTRDSKEHLIPYLHTPEERGAYGFQYWASGDLDLTGNKSTSGVFQRLVDNLKKVCGLSRSCGTRVDSIFDDIASGAMLRSRHLDLMRDSSYGPRQAPRECSLSLGM